MCSNEHAAKKRRKKKNIMNSFSGNSDMTADAVIFFGELFGGSYPGLRYLDFLCHIFYNQSNFAVVLKIQLRNLCKKGYGIRRK